MKDPDTLALERDLGALLGLAVEIRFRGSGGSLVFNYSRWISWMISCIG